MSRIGVIAAAAALAVVACRKDGKEAKNGASSAETVSVTGVVSGVDPDQVQVTTDDGRQLALKMNQTVAVTLAGGEAETAVITEGAPVRVSYRPKGSGGDLVTIDVEPQAANGRGELKDGAAQPDPPANPDRARQGR
jgi:ABC-type Fe3+-hydroxamate transport system substrate-binding protein